jgi:hypothetical protein
MSVSKNNVYYLWTYILLVIVIGPFVYSQSITSTNSMNINIIEPWKPVTVKLMEPDSTNSTVGQYKIGNIAANVANYKFSNRPKSGVAALSGKFPILKIHIPSSRKICFIDPEHTFYIFDGKEIKGYTIGPGVLIWSSGYLASAESEGDAAAIAHFESSFNSKMLNDAWGKRDTNRIGLREATPQFYFSDGLYPGGATPTPEVIAIGMTNDILHLDIQNEKTKIPASLWIDLKAKKVIKSVVDGQEMDLNSGKPFAVPKKK